MRIAPLIGTTIVFAGMLVTAALASGSTQSHSRAAPAWAQPLSGIRPYYVEHNYGASNGLTCDLRIYTTNRAALEGKAKLRPGDVTATVCVVHRAGKPAGASK
jgi:hypothetical protein